MKVIFFLSFVVFIACNDKIEEKQEQQSVLTLLSKEIALTPNNPELFVKRAEYFITENNLQSALVDYQQCLKLLPSNGHYHYKVAYLYYEIAKVDKTKQRYPEKALSHLEKALQLHSDSILVLLLKAELQLVFSEPKKAILHLNQVIELDYNVPKAHLLKGYIYSALGDEVKAKQFFHNAIDIDVNYEEAYVQLGLIYQKKKDSTAVMFYKNVLRITPNNKLALFNLAKFYQDTEQWNYAIEYYTTLLQYYPTYSDAYYNLGFVHIKLGLYDIASKDFSQAISFNSNFFQAFYSRGHCYETLGDIYHAELDYKKAISINPSYDAAQVSLENLYTKNKQIKK